MELIVFYLESFFFDIALKKVRKITGVYYSQFFKDLVLGNFFRSKFIKSKTECISFFLIYIYFLNMFIIFS